MKKKNRNKKKALKSLKRTGFTKHHIVPKSKGGSNNQKNIKYLKGLQHNAFHTLFSNQEPLHQFVTLLSINNTALNKEFIGKLIKLIFEYKDNPYIKEVVKWMVMIRTV